MGGCIGSQLVRDVLMKYIIVQKTYTLSHSEVADWFEGEPENLHNAMEELVESGQFNQFHSGGEITAVWTEGTDEPSQPSLG